MNESYALGNGGQYRGIFLGEKHPDVTLTQEHDGLSYGASSRKLWLNYSNHSFLNLLQNMVSRKIKKKTPEGNFFV